LSALVARNREPSNDRAGRAGCTERPQAGRSIGLESSGLLPSFLVLQIEPGAVLLAAGDRLLNEIHPLGPVVDVGIHRVAGLELLAALLKDHRVERRAIHVRERLEERLGMSARQTAGGF